ncbi:hypothetical protein N7532_008693 [Penicillium argentinense]|uniref:Chlorophyllase n=1 Tax=Penicillium argentinense TaxID=1131581 RepID=A0A9W9EY31_9EURO|nr:uncharacterized protein N7532_008693 [Penicillium argentinense]KAJ5090009.1 hypothetical protein N7532_008693 [Penicillium argentinense]
MTATQSSSSRLSNMKDHTFIGDAAKIPVNDPTPVISISPIVLEAPDRIIDLHLRVSAPTTGTNLPIILFSHGQGKSNHLSSLNGYGPIANFWAAHGFVVIQPTHLSSMSLSLDNDAVPGDGPMFWRSRAQDMKLIFDQLDNIESAFPQIQGRLDHSRVAVAGHSMGGHTASMLMGARTRDSPDAPLVDLIEPRIKTGVLLAAPGDGRGGDGMSDRVKENWTFLTEHTHAEMSTPALVVIGENDGSPFLTTRGAAYHADAYHSSKGAKSLLTLAGGYHGLGGVSGYDTAEATDDESPERLGVTQRLTWAYLWSQFYPDDPAWLVASTALSGLPALGKVESK